MRKMVGIMAFSARGEHDLHGSYAACSMGTVLLDDSGGEGRYPQANVSVFGFDSW
jgi:hypothetical protein